MSQFSKKNFTKRRNKIYTQINFDIDSDCEEFFSKNHKLKFHCIEIDQVFYYKNYFPYGNADSFQRKINQIAEYNIQEMEKEKTKNFVDAPSRTLRTQRIKKNKRNKSRVLNFLFKFDFIIHCFYFLFSDWNNG